MADYPSSSAAARSSVCLVAKAAHGTTALASTLYGLVAATTTTTTTSSLDDNNDDDDHSQPPSLLTCPGLRRGVLITKHVASGVRDLSTRLRELRNLLQKVIFMAAAENQQHHHHHHRGGSGVLLFRRGLLTSVDALARQTQELLAEIRRGLVAGEVVVEPGEEGRGGDDDDGGRLPSTGDRGWSDTPPPTPPPPLLWDHDGILAKTDALKLAVELVQSVMALVWEQEVQTTWDHQEEENHQSQQDERILLRTQAETLIQAIKQFLSDASSSSEPTTTTTDIDGGIHADDDELDRPPSSSLASSPAGTPSFAARQDTTTGWLYRFVFGDVMASLPTTCGRHHHTTTDSYPPSVSSNMPDTDVVMDSLLRAWSSLDEDEILELRDLSLTSSSSSSSSSSSCDDENRAQANETLLTRAGVQRMVSEALSYAQQHERARDKDGRRPGGTQSPPTRSGGPRRRRTSSQDGSSSDVVVTQISAHPNLVGFGEIWEYDDGLVGENQHDSPSDGEPPEPPLPQQHHLVHNNAGRRRSRTASWVLSHGSRRARSRSAERRARPASASASASTSASARPSQSRSRLVEWTSHQARVKSLDASRSLSSVSPGDKRAYQQQQAPRISQHNPPQKVLFTSPVARLASSSTAIGTTTTTSELPLRPPSSPTPHPKKSILKPPTHHFPEELNPVREGIAPHKSDKTKKDAPPGAKWTKIKRSWVNPEALAAGKERFEVLGDHHVKVLRVLSREEIEAYRVATAQLRALRQMRQSGDEKEEDEEQDEAKTKEKMRPKSSQDGEGWRESSGSVVSRYAVQGSRAVPKRSPSPRRKKEGILEMFLASI